VDYKFKDQLQVLVFGATGSIGNAICQKFIELGYKVTAITRNNPSDIKEDNMTWIKWDLADKFDAFITNSNRKFNAIVWAQGLNFNDNIYNVDISNHLKLYQANILYIIESLNALLQFNLIEKNSKLCIVSSIWQELGKPNKLSYMITKSALKGLVQSLMIDLAHKGILVNAVLPGALDTPMTHANLNLDQIESIKKITPINKLIDVNLLSNLIAQLCAESNTGITGQFINVDGGFSHAKIF
jgi:3-oxoacyl-[acyl-carrier protein] reductase